MRRSLAVLAIIFAATIEARAVQCHASKGAERAHWSWREIDGRRCWYQGHRRLSKSQLNWSVSRETEEISETSSPRRNKSRNNRRAKMSEPRTIPLDDPIPETRIKAWPGFDSFIERFNALKGKPE